VSWADPTDQLSRVDWHVPLIPEVDLRVCLEAGRQRLIDEGCKMDEISWRPFVFGGRCTERICLQIEALAPEAPSIAALCPNWAASLPICKKDCSNWASWWTRPETEFTACT